MMTTIAVILIVWVALAVPVSFLAARMLRSDLGASREAARHRTDESHPGRSFR
ncbi:MULTISPECIES: hypothetical protein [Nocardia]|uniref:Uncharacterized protein n=2 Tax=Nocardia TaxID=1817 RepID=A0A4R6PUJ1_NOCIG|nr:MULTISPECIES: hypothetical protein [Nocardia]NKX88059.1 hypothetical protein [Nocardia coubleae]TDP41923.1 hypothetical protein DFR75_1011028 [Nocardia ignorata]